MSYNTKIIHIDRDKLAAGGFMAGISVGTIGHMNSKRRHVGEDYTTLDCGRCQRCRSERNCNLTVCLGRY